VYNANGYFLATANLLVFEDHGSKRVTGGVLENTLSAAPSPTVSEDIATSAGPTYTGTVTVGSNRRFEISGFVNTSRGRVETTVSQTLNFLSKQEFDVNATTDIQSAQQSSTVDSRTTTHGGPNAGVVEKHLSYPLTIDYSFIVNSDGSFSQTVTSDQQDLVRDVLNHGDGPSLASNERNEVNATDTLNWDASGNILGPTGSKTTQTYRLQSAHGYCWDRRLTAEAQKLFSIIGGPGCDD
jgi:hypothetical protein